MYTPVSYTHLFAVPCLDGEGQVLCLDKTVVAPFKLLAEHLCVKPVSYTHLDVYKRQILNGVAAMQHFSAAHIDTHMGNARCIVSADEKDQVAGSCVGRGYRGGNIVESLRCV